MEDREKPPLTDPKRGEMDMFGAIYGDVIGSYYETPGDSVDYSIKSIAKEFCATYL